MCASGELEEVYGSVAFLVLNCDLVAITMALCVLLYHLLITRCGKTHLVQQQAVGCVREKLMLCCFICSLLVHHASCVCVLRQSYSCVLFAWMVAASVRMQQYCPLFFLPSLCFPTWHLPLPFLLREGLPVNLGPFVLLLVTKLVLPQSSLTGHLAGIMAGFPLAWGLLDWASPPLLGAVLAVSYVHLEGLWVWALPG